MCIQSWGEIDLLDKHDFLPPSLPLSLPPTFCVSVSLLCLPLIHAVQNSPDPCPHSVALWLLPTRRRYLFWADWGDVSRIERSRLDGSERVAVVNSSIIWPNGLTVDYEEGVLYWCDAGLNRISAIDLDGGARRLVREGGMDAPFAITVYQDYLYWTDR